MALSRVTPENGGIVFHPRTHKLGYLGDAGELKPISAEFMCPELTQGDFVIMHSALWHESRANTNGIDRVLADIIVQPASDPSGKELLRGEWKTNMRISQEAAADLFVRSRTSRLKELQEKLHNLGYKA